MALSDTVMALRRLGQLRPSDIATLRDLAREPSGRAAIVQSLASFLDRARTDDVADWDGIFALGVQMRSVLEPGSELPLSAEAHPPALLLLAGFRGCSFEQACREFCGEAEAPGDAGGSAGFAYRQAAG